MPAPMWNPVWAAVVACILKRDLRPVGRIVHERVDAALGHLRRCVHTQGRVGRLAQHKFLAPVAQQVGGERRVLFVPLHDAVPVAFSRVPPPDLVIDVPFRSHAPIGIQ